MKTQKGFIQIPLLIAIIAGVLVLSGAGYFGVKRYQSYQTEQGNKEKLAEINKQAEQERSQKLQESLDLQSHELEKQKTEIEALKNRKPETNTQTIIKEVPVQKAENDLPTIINQWKNRVAEVTCEWQYANGVAYASARGSATIYNSAWYGRAAVTNKHVVSTILNGTEYPPNWCVVKIYGIGETKIGYTPQTSKPFSWGTNADFGYISLTNAIISSGNDFFTNLPNFNVCSGANVGDKLVILGYPSIGTQNGITATEGIVSGIENDYYVTSAKIDHGNSGGLAILLKDNCYLGIPSAAAVGTIESLGRILKGTLIFTN